MSNLNKRKKRLVPGSQAITHFFRAKNLSDSHNDCDVTVSEPGMCSSVE